MRLLAHQIAVRLKVLDVNEVLELPMHQIMNWMEFLHMEADVSETTEGRPTKITPQTPEEMWAKMQKAYG